MHQRAGISSFRDEKVKIRGTALKMERSHHDCAPYWLYVVYVVGRADSGAL